MTDMQSRKLTDQLMLKMMEFLIDVLIIIAWYIYTKYSNKGDK